MAERRRETKERGFSCVALWKPKNEHNIGSTVRAAGAFGARLTIIGSHRVFTPGRLGRTDPGASHKHMPVIFSQDLLDALPHECTAVAVEMGGGDLRAFVHPERAAYIFGSEDHGLPQEVIDVCDCHVSIPAGSLNLAAAVNVVMYDRALKRGL